MGKNALAAILYPLFCINKISTTIFSQSVQRTETKQTVKLFFGRVCVAWEIFTFCMAEVVGLFFNVWHKASPLSGAKTSPYIPALNLLYGACAKNIIPAFL
jgi:hypothetical protein